MRESSSVRSFFMLVLFLVFGISMFLCVFFEISGYEKISRSCENSSDEHLPFAYLTQKMRSSLDIETENNILILQNENAVTYIYWFEGYLYELTTLPDHHFDPSHGEKLYEVESLDIKKKENHIDISYVVKGKEKKVIFSLRGNQYE